MRTRLTTSESRHDARIGHVAVDEVAREQATIVGRSLRCAAAPASNRPVHDEPGLQTLLAQWFENEDRRALRAAFDVLWAALPRPRDLCRRLGPDEVEAVILDELEVLLRRNGGELRHARAPLAFATRHVKLRLLDRLRKERRRERLAPTVALHPGEEPAGATSVAPDVEGMELLRALTEALRAMTVDRRVAFLLRHAPTRISDADWEVVARRHLPPPPARPEAPPDDETAAHLLNPSASVDAYRKNLQRALDDLAQVLLERRRS